MRVWMGKDDDSHSPCHLTVFNNSAWKHSERNGMQSKSTSVSVLRLRSLQPFIPKSQVASHSLMMEI